jgi:murein DD-endopeptidase MepM/ murein hydrolase activator NlpD
MRGTSSVRARAKRRFMQVGVMVLAVAGTAALAAPVVRQASAVSASPLEKLAATPQVEESAQAMRLVWRGLDVDGDGQPDFANPTGKGVRDHDAYGAGAFGARRDGGSRRHAGVDFMADAGQRVNAPISGFVTKIGYAYADDTDLKFVEITNPALRYSARVFYVDPDVEVGQPVRMGQDIGRHATLERKYPGGMTDHVHLEIIDSAGVRIDATEVIRAAYEPAPRSRG